MSLSAFANIAVICFEAIGLGISIPRRHWQVLAYYTQLSNIAALISSVAFIGWGEVYPVTVLRYISTCMLTMTFLITLFVLVPMGGGFKRLMLSGNGLYHHTICPAISVASYILLEQHTSPWIIPVIITFIYGVVMLLMNYYRKFDGPYPFFRVHNQSRTATFIWMVVLIAVITVISLGVSFIAG